MVSGKIVHVTINKMKQILGKNIRGTWNILMRYFVVYLRPPKQIMFLYLY
jgi:hypothetical protein